MPSQRPSHRNPDVFAQLEVCALCGAKVDNRRLIEADVEGLRGWKICDTHPFERRSLTEPSFNDYRAFTPPADAPEAGARLEPIGVGEWWRDPEVDYGDWETGAGVEE